MFEDLFVKVKDAKGNAVNTGHIFWTTNSELDPLYADLDLCSNPELVCSTQEHKEIIFSLNLFPPRSASL